MELTSSYRFSIFLMWRMALRSWMTQVSVRPGSARISTISTSSEEVKRVVWRSAPPGTAHGLAHQSSAAARPFCSFLGSFWSPVVFSALPTRCCIAPCCGRGGRAGEQKQQPASTSTSRALLAILHRLPCAPATQFHIRLVHLRFVLTARGTAFHFIVKTTSRVKFFISFVQHIYGLMGRLFPSS